MAKLKSHWLLIALLLVNIPPMFTRIDFWPSSSHPMFSERVNIENIWAFQIYFKNREGKETQLPVFCHKLAIYLIDKNLADRNLDRVKKVMEAIVWTDIRSLGAGSLVLYRSQKMPGTEPGEGVKREKLIEIPWNS